MKQSTVLSSQQQKKSISLTRKIILHSFLKHPVHFDKTKPHLSGLDKINTMTYTWYEVSSDYRDKIIRYHNLTEFKELYFTNTCICYSYSVLSVCIKSIFVNCDLEPDRESQISIQLTSQVLSFSSCLPVDLLLIPEK